MTTKTITVSLAELFPELLHKRDGGAPFGWLANIATNLEARFGEEAKAGFITGLHECGFSRVHTMTEVEVRDEKIAALEAKIAALKASVPASGEGTVTLTYDEIRAL